MGQLQLHQDRVVDEKTQLDDRLAKLTVFLESQTFAGLDAAEQGRLRRQRTIMGQLSEVLAERIAAFGSPQ